MRETCATAVLLYAGWAALLVWFYALNSGLTCTNDGSHFALVDSLIERGAFVLQDNARLAGHDTAVYGGRTYAGRDPGLGLAALVFYRATRFLLPLQVPLCLDPYTVRNATPDEKARLGLLMILPCLCGALLCTAVYCLLREFDAPPRLGLGLAFGLVPATLFLRYSTVFYAHALTAVLVTFGFICFLASRRPRSDQARGLLALGSFLFAQAVVCEPLAVLLYVPLLGYLVARRERPVRDLRQWLALGLGALGPGLVLATFNTINFDQPLFGAYFHHATYAYNRSLKAAFSPTLAETAGWTWRLLFGGAPFTSVFGSSPVLLLALASVPLFWTRKRRWTPEHGLLLASFAIVLVATAMYKEPFAGYDLDYRYLLFALPCLFPFVAETVAWFAGAVRQPFARTAAGAGLGLLLLMSIQRQLAHVRHPLQTLYDRHLVNLAAAGVNTLPFLLLGAALMALWLCWSTRLPPAADDRNAGPPASPGHFEAQDADALRPQLDKPAVRNGDGAEVPGRG